MAAIALAPDAERAHAVRAHVAEGHRWRGPLHAPKCWLKPPWRQAWPRS